MIFMAIYLSIPFLLLFYERGRARAAWLDAAAILWIWLPIEFGVVRRFLLTSNIAADFSYSFAQALAINMGSLRSPPGGDFRESGIDFNWDARKSSRPCCRS
jgi:hypothetical protein